MNPTRMLFALRDVLDEELSALPLEEESTVEERQDLIMGLMMVTEQARIARAGRPSSLPERKPLVSALGPPKGDYWTIFRKLPDGTKPGAFVVPLSLHGRAAQYELVPGANFIPVSDWDGAVPDTLEAQYASGAVAVYGPKQKPRERETPTLLWSRSRTVAVLWSRSRQAIDYGVRAAHAEDHVELKRILDKIPPGAGDMHVAVKADYERVKPEPEHTGPQNISVAEQLRAAGRTRAAAKRAKEIARAQGDLPEDVELAGELAAAAVAPGKPIARNSFGTPGASR